MSERLRTKRRVRTLAALGCLVALMGGAGMAGAASRNDPSIEVTAYVPMAPVRVLDTRTGVGTPVGKISNLTLAFDPVTAVPADARAVVLNVTATEPTDPSYISVQPTGGPDTGVSNVNFMAGETTANQVTVPLGPGNAVRIRNSVGQVHVVVDLAGYYVDAPAGGAVGPQGIPGIPGPQGPQGSLGAPGINGTNGLPGTQGLTGSDGAQGLIGPNGLPGSNGLNGAAGIDGVNGANGAAGATGLDGAAGTPGINGTNGLDGNPGTNGLDGAPGIDGTNGIDGNPGTNGLDGTPGIDGTNGIDGNPGINGLDGAPGINGTDGAEGPAGPTGETGAAGASGPASYALIYNTTAQLVAIEGDVVFNTNGVVKGGIAHTAGTAEITLVNSGDYLISFSLSATEINQFSLFLNGAPVAGALYGSGSGSQQNSGQVILTATAGDVVTVRNHTSFTGVNLPSNIGGSQTTTNASIMVQQLSVGPIPD